MDRYKDYRQKWVRLFWGIGLVATVASAKNARVLENRCRTRSRLGYRSYYFAHSDLPQLRGNQVSSRSPPSAGSPSTDGLTVWMREPLTIPIPFSNRFKSRPSPRVASPSPRDSPPAVPQDVKARFYSTGRQRFYHIDIPRPSRYRQERWTPLSLARAIRMGQPVVVVDAGHGGYGPGGDFPIPKVPQGETGQSGHRLGGRPDS